MARPKRSDDQMLYDQFADMNLAEQEIVLRFLSEIHRQAKRQASKRFAPNASEQAALDGMEKPQ